MLKFIFYILISVIDNPPSKPMGNSFKNKDLFSKSSISIMDTMVTEKNFDNANQMINNSTTLIDSEFLKKNGGENINKLKTKYLYIHI